jgi:hypothetical protein
VKKVVVMITIQDLIAKNERDIVLFLGYLASVTGKPGTLQYIGDLRRRITAAERAASVLRHAACWPQLVQTVGQSIPAKCRLKDLRSALPAASSVA